MSITLAALLAVLSVSIKLTSGSNIFDETLLVMVDSDLTSAVEKAINLDLLGF